MALLALTGPALFPYFVCRLLKISSFKSPYSETLPPPEQDAQKRSDTRRLLRQAQDELTWGVRPEDGIRLKVHGLMITQEIDKARALYEAHGRALREDGRVHELLGSYREAIAHTYQAMAEEGVLTACAQCARGPSGSCCFEGVEDWYDPVLLLINLLLGVPLPSGREIPNACFFVGPGGCKLRGRYAFCVNFLCPKLNAQIRNGNLLRTGGQELLCGWELEREIRRRINPGAGRPLPQQGSGP
jgi:hypothetical protein